jgi:hypothetical protein
MEAIELAKRFIAGIRVLAIPRLEDLPYSTSPPIQFVYESTATLNLGVYTWNDVPSALTPVRPVLHNALYFFRNLTLAADITELDFQAATLSASPIQYFMFRQADARAVLFREPIIMNKFYEQFDYRLTWTEQQTNDQLLAAFRGVLVQTPALVGKVDITLKAIITAQEIVDKNYIELFKRRYPLPPAPENVNNG